MHNFSSLYHVKLTFMKPKECSKIVYFNSNNVYIRRSSDGKSYTNIESDMPGILFCIDRYKISKLNFMLGDRAAVLWRDKHGNYILRYDNKQLSINF